MQVASTEIFRERKRESPQKATPGNPGWTVFIPEQKSPAAISPCNLKWKTGIKIFQLYPPPSQNVIWIWAWGGGSLEYFLFCDYTKNALTCRCAHKRFVSGNKNMSFAYGFRKASLHSLEKTCFLALSWGKKGRTGNGISRDGSTSSAFEQADPGSVLASFCDFLRYFSAKQNSRPRKFNSGHKQELRDSACLDATRLKLHFTLAPVC